MKNGDTPINAVFNDIGHITGETDSETGHADFYGLTKREHFAGLAMQGLIASMAAHDLTAWGDIAHDAVGYADALLAELAKEQQP